jgi:hypothetical protein
MLKMLCSTNIQNSNSNYLIMEAVQKWKKSNIYNSEQCKLSEPQNLLDLVMFAQPRVYGISSSNFVQ